MDADLLRLRNLSFAPRVGVAALVIVLLGGLAASAAHLHGHYENRDEQEGLSVDDLKGAYHGIQSTAPLRVALERNHPPELPAEDRTLLLDWLSSDRISEGYDDLDLGDAAPAEVLARNCLDCHSRQAKQGGDIGTRIPLNYFDDVESLAVSREIQPTPVSVMINSTHVHALSLGTLSLVIAALALATAWPRRLMHIGIMLMGVGLLVDLAAWWIVRGAPSAMWLLIGAGGLYNGVSVLLLLAVLVDLCLKRPPRPEEVT